MANKKELKKRLYALGYPYRVLNGLRKPELEYLISKHKDGAGLAEVAKKLFMEGSNVVRKAIRASGDPNARDLEYGEMHITGIDPKTGKYFYSNYMGPGTRIDKYPDAKPFDEADALAREHDFAYARASSEPNDLLRKKMIREADEKLKDDLRKLKNPSLLKFMGIMGMESKMALENVVPRKIAEKYIDKKYYGRN